MKARSRSCYKIIVYVLLASSIKLLSQTHMFNVLDDKELTIVDEEAIDGTVLLTRERKLPETKHLPEEDAEFHAPDDKELTIVDEEAMDGTVLLTRERKLPETKHLPEEDPDFHPPDRRFPYIVAFGPGNSLELVSSRKQMGVDSPTIILWNGQEPSKKDVKKDYQFVLSQKCGGCLVTRDRSYVEESAAIVFFNDIGLFQESPPDQQKRKPQQVYVFWSRETQAKTVKYRSKLENSAFDGIFNLTFFFRRDADIVQYFGNRESILRHSKLMEHRIGRKKFFESKTKGALWFVSNCDRTYGAVKRLMYAKRLIQEGLDLDKFGECFTSAQKKYNSENIDQSQYRFYLSFENSIHCADYVTEKFWRNAFQAGLVPIVFGPAKEDVEAIAPPNSYIFAEDFKSARQLVKYLNYLTRNNTAYMEYHRWRDQETDEAIPEEDIAIGPQASFCRLCKRQTLRSVVVPTKSIPSIAKWMYDKRYIDDQCYKPV